jgi:DNA-binding response OmpR family regulator
MHARIHVLVIDDDVDVQGSLSTWLQASGHEVTIVGTGEAGIEATSQVRFDVVVSELKLPGIDGVQMLRRLRDQQKSVPVVFTQSKRRQRISFGHCANMAVSIS